MTAEQRWQRLLHQQLQNFLAAAPNDRAAHARGMWVLMQTPPGAVDGLNTDASEQDVAAILRWLEGEES